MLGDKCTVVERAMIGATCTLTEGNVMCEQYCIYYIYNSGYIMYQYCVHSFSFKFYLTTLGGCYIMYKYCVYI